MAQDAAPQSQAVAALAGEGVQQMTWSEAALTRQH